MKLECIGFVNFQPENIRQGIYGLVTIVLERAWAALKCDQLPVVFTVLSHFHKDCLVKKSKLFFILQVRFYCGSCKVGMFIYLSITAKMFY